MAVAGDNPTTSTPPLAPPAWAENATGLTSFLHGLAAIVAAPGFVLMLTSTGFGALARDLGFTLAQAAFITGSLYALPAQVLMIDQLARGAALGVIALAISLTAIRLLPMTVSLMPFVREEPRPTARGWLLRLLVSHYFAVSSWLEGMRRLPHLPHHLRLPHIAGVGTAMLGATMIGTIVGFTFSRGLPVAAAAALLMMTPLYFLFSLAAGASSRMDWAALVIGSLLGPVLFMLMPGFDLMITGVVGGTAAYVIGRGMR